MDLGKKAVGGTGQEEQPMKMPDRIPEEMLAPCGITCAVCYVHLRDKKPCPGCRGKDAAKPEHCRKCKIKNCAVSRRVGACHECASFPCALLKRLDRSYRQRYRVSLIENALRLRDLGARGYLLEERQKWTCACGGAISLHDAACSECGAELRG